MTDPFGWAKVLAGGLSFGALVRTGWGWRSLFEFIVLSPTGSPDAAVPIAATRAGALGVVSLEFALDRDLGLAQLQRLCDLGRGRAGALIDDQEVLESVLSARHEALDAIVLANQPGDSLGALIGSVHEAGLRAYVVAGRLEEALEAEEASADAVIAKGHEAGGWIGEQGAFVLFQQLLGNDQRPRLRPRRNRAEHGRGRIRVRRGGSGARRAAAAGARVAPEREHASRCRGRWTAARRQFWEASSMPRSAPTRRPGLKSLGRLRDERAGSAEARSRARTGVGPSGPMSARAVAGEEVLPLGQDACFAADLAQRFGTVAGIIAGLRAASRRRMRGARARQSAGATGPAGAVPRHRAIPIVQGPMTRVSDRAEFAAAVAEAGALPFLALALMRAPEADALLERTRELCGDRPWGVGILGFVAGGAARRAAGGRPGAPARPSR